MLNYKHIVFFFAIATLTLSCGENYLEPAPSAAVGGSAYYTTEAQLETAVVNMYDGIQGGNALKNTSEANNGVQLEFYLTEMRSDNTRTKSSEGEAAQFENYSLESTNGIVENYYRSYYNIIFRANTVLENIGVASADNARRIEAEAKFVRAYAYFNLVRLFGDVPYVDRVIRLTETDIQYARVGASTIYGNIISDLENAIAGLDNSQVNRASKAAAQGLLAKVYLTQGTNYVGAQSLCEDIMSDGSYALEANFKDVFYTEGNGEIIFAIGYAGDNVNDSQNFSSEWLNAVGRTSGVNYVTTEAREALDMLGGDRTLFSYRQDALQPAQNQVVKYLPNGDEDLGIAATSTDPQSAGNDWIVLRYADVLLMHVEAIMAGGSSTTVGAALASFQEVRDRAGLTTAVTEVTMQDLLDERRVELAFENQRFFDLVRFGVAQDVLSTFSAANGYGFSATDLLLPIPQREINLSNGALSQNPGY